MKRGRPTPAAFVRYGRFVRQWRPDLVHSHMVHANLLARLGRVFAPSTPVVCTIHNVNEGRRWREIAYRFTDPFANATTAVSRAAAERFVRVGAVPRRRMRFMPNGLDFGRAPATEAERARVRADLGAGTGFLWVAVGRLMPEKGHDLLITALHQVCEMRPEARLVIAGEGPQRQKLEALIARLELGDKVALLGVRTDVPSILAAADAFVMSSRWEGLPISLLEAASQALPMVSTDVGGCREVVNPDVGGVLVSADPDELATAMLEVMGRSAEDRAATGRDLRDFARSEFDLDEVVTRWESLYSSLIARREARTSPARRSGA
jgi:glycosyltransferase involved in cell wall biosynthesis